MNERIKELADQVGAVHNVLAMGRHDGVLFTETELEKFAELIVLECVQACINEGRTFEVASAGEYSSNLYASAIKKHFGVE